MSTHHSGIHRSHRPRTAIPMDKLVTAAERVDGVRRRDVEVGERVVVFTRNSVYSLTARADGAFDVSGGWFQRMGVKEKTVQVAGCTAGGHALFTDHIAAPGLFLEFADRLRTTRIRAVQHITNDRRPC